MPEKLEELIARLEEQWNGKEAFSVVKLVRSDHSLLEELKEIHFIRELLNIQRKPGWPDWFLLDRFYQGSVSNALFWNIFYLLCTSDELWERFNKIHQLHAEADVDDSNITIHESPHSYDDFKPVLNSQFSDGHLILTEASPELDYQISSDSVSTLSDDDHALNILDSAEISGSSFVISVSFVLEENSGQLVLECESSEKIQEGFSAVLDQGEKIIEPTEIKKFDNQCLITFDQVDLNANSVLRINY